jgi:hypothetical protein
MVVVLLSSCAQRMVAPGEMPENGYAYVVGKMDDQQTAEQFFFSKYTLSENIFLPNISGAFVFHAKNRMTDYSLIKVSPGTYHMTYINEYNERSQIITFDIHNGKVNYIGTIAVKELKKKGFIFDDTYASATVKYEPEEAVKEILKKKYPHLIQFIDNNFVVQRARPRR